MPPLLTYWVHPLGWSLAQIQSFNRGTNNMQCPFFSISKNLFLDPISYISFLAM